MPPHCHDVAIVGGGIADTLLANALASHRLDVVVAEAGEAGWGRVAMPSDTSVPVARWRSGFGLIEPGRREMER